MYYQVALDEELYQVNRAIDYYLEWAEEFRSTTYKWEFVSYYYKGLLDPKNGTGIQFRALFFAMRIQPVLTYVKQFLKEHQRPPHILDRGCGFGLESILICLTGAKVHGVDGWIPMIDHAQNRLLTYQEKHHFSLDLHYQHSNVFDFNPTEPYDAVYSSATLHHIEPVADAFHAIARFLKPQGHFFLSDENGYSPLQQVVVQKKIGWKTPRKYWRTDPDTGVRFLYGNENIRPAFLWARYMKQAHLQPESIKYCRFMPPVDWSVKQLVQIERRLRNIPLITQLGAIGFLYTARNVSP